MGPCRPPWSDVPTAHKRRTATFSSACAISSRAASNGADWRSSGCLRRVTSRKTTTVRSSPNSFSNTAELTSAGNALPSLRSMDSSPKNRPVDSRSRSPSAQRGSDGSASPDLPRARISSSERPSTRHAAGFAARIWPSGAVNMTASRLRTNIVDDSVCASIDAARGDRECTVATGSLPAQASTVELGSCAVPCTSETSAARSSPAGIGTHAPCLFLDRRIAGEEHERCFGPLRANRGRDLDPGCGVQVARHHDEVESILVHQIGSSHSRTTNRWSSRSARVISGASSPPCRTTIALIGNSVPRAVRRRGLADGTASPRSAVRSKRPSARRSPPRTRAWKSWNRCVTFDSVGGGRRGRRSRRNNGGSWHVWVRWCDRDRLCSSDCSRVLWDHGVLRGMGRVDDPVAAHPRE